MHKFSYYDADYLNTCHHPGLLLLRRWSSSSPSEKVDVSVPDFSGLHVRMSLDKILDPKLILIVKRLKISKLNIVHLPIEQDSQKNLMTKARCTGEQL